MGHNKENNHYTKMMTKLCAEYRDYITRQQENRLKMSNVL